MPFARTRALGKRLKRWLVNAALVLLSLAVGFLAINAAFPLVFHQSVFPRALVASAGNLQYTLYPDTYDPGQLDSWVAVVGDSYAQGMGDSYLAGDRDYAIFHYLRAKTGKSYLLFGRSGFGSIEAARELAVDVELMNDALLLPDLGRPEEILVLFYEGNDLNNNLLRLESVGDDREDVRAFVRDELNQEPSLEDRLDSQLPFTRLLYTLARDLVRAATGRRSDLSEPAAGEQNRLTLHGQELVVGPLQSAAVELSERDIERALAAFVDSLDWLREWAPNARIRVVYIPSIVTTYDWVEPVLIQTYHSDGPMHVLSEDNLRHSTLIRSRLRQAVLDRGLDFIDTTEPIRARARTVRLHGPRDWKHPNAQGYAAIADVIAESTP